MPASLARKLRGGSEMREVVERIRFHPSRYAKEFVAYRLRCRSQMPRATLVFNRRGIGVRNPLALARDQIADCFSSYGMNFFHLRIGFAVGIGIELERRSVPLETRWYKATR